VAIAAAVMALSRIADLARSAPTLTLPARDRLLAPVMNANEHRRCSFPTPLSYPLFLGHRAIRDDVAWRVLAGRIGLRHLFTPQTG
jgi:hypothetical protein